MHGFMVSAEMPSSSLEQKRKIPIIAKNVAII